MILKIFFKAGPCNVDDDYTKDELIIITIIIIIISKMKSKKANICFTYYVSRRRRGNYCLVQGEG